MIKEISSKKPKTDSDLEEMARLEFFGGLYMMEGGPVIPAENLSKMLINAAKKEKKGKQVGAGVIISKHGSLIYDGPRDAEGLWEKEEFRYQQMVRVGNGKVLRTRPIFEDWSVLMEVEYEDSLINVNDIERWLGIGGFQIGLLERRPEQYGRLGRFSVEALSGNGSERRDS